MPVDKNKINLKKPSTKAFSSVDSFSLKTVATKGAIWIALISLLAVPLAYYRNWILAQFDADGSVIGTFALILLFIEIVGTFVMLGGSSVLTNYMPKIEQKAEKSSFLLSYSLISIPTGVIFTATIILWPETLSILTGKDFNSEVIDLFIFLVPITVLSQLVMFGLNGLMRFQILALLSQFQLVTVTISSTVAYLYFQDYFAENALTIICRIVAFANCLIAIIGGLKIYKTLGWPRRLLVYPKGFWRFASFVHGNTLCTLAFTSMDKLFIVSSLGVAELGIYFLLLQCAELVRFIPSKIGQVLLASFSSLVAEGKNDELVNAYEKLCKIMMAFSGCSAIGLILFSEFVATIFGDWIGDKYRYLILLSAIINIGSLGSVNAMLVLAKEKSAPYLLNSIIQITTQFAVTLLLISDFGVYGVIIGKFMGIVVAQLGLFFIIFRKIPDLGLAPPREYWLGQLVVLSTALWAYLTNCNDILVSILASFVILPFYILVIKFNPLELQRILSRHLKG